MDTADQSQTKLISEYDLIQDIKAIIISEYRRTNKLWMRFSEIAKIFNQNLGFSLEYVLVYYGYEHNWKSFFVRGRIFSIYPSQSYTDFHVSLLSLSAPNSSNPRWHQTKYKTNNSCKSDSQSTKIPNDEESIKVSNAHLSHSQIISSNLPISIESIDLLKEALIMIITILVEQNPRKCTNTMELSSYFTKKYNQSIKNLMKKLFVDMKLIEFIQSLEELRTQKSNGDWQIFISKKLF